MQRKKMISKGIVINMFSNESVTARKTNSPKQSKTSKKRNQRPKSATKDSSSTNKNDTSESDYRQTSPLLGEFSCPGGNKNKRLVQQFMENNNKLIRIVVLSLAPVPLAITIFLFISLQASNGNTILNSLFSLLSLASGYMMRGIGIKSTKKLISSTNK